MNAEAPPAARQTRFRKRVLPWVVPILFLMSWQIASRTGWLPPKILPAPMPLFRLPRT